jgi:hypothetical protein
MTTIRLTDDQWTKFLAFLRRDPHAYIGNAQPLSPLCRHRTLDRPEWRAVALPAR